MGSCGNLPPLYYKPLFKWKLEIFVKVSDYLPRIINKPPILFKLPLPHELPGEACDGGPSCPGDWPAGL